MIEHVKNTPAPGLDGLPQKWRDEWETLTAHHFLTEAFSTGRALADRHAAELQLALQTPADTADQYNDAVAYFGNLDEYKSIVLQDLIGDLQNELDERTPACIHCDGHEHTIYDDDTQEWFCTDCDDWALLEGVAK